MKHLKTIGFIIMLFLAFGLNAQERLVGLQNNPILLDGNYAPKKANIVRSAVSINLPFIDDFAKAGPFSDPAKWEESGVFINNSYAINMPTVGVATFDAIDAQGSLYNAGGVLSEPADTLESLDIDLSYTAADNIFLSFCYQAGGLGDLPENTDSLTLQFLSSSNQWINVWSTSARRDSIVERNHLAGTTTIRKEEDITAEFFSTYIKIDRSEFLFDGFRFRFINYASVAINTFVPGRSSNSDHWHLDVVYLNRGRADGDNIPDVAINVPIQPFSYVYESIPWKHFNNNSYTSLFGSTLNTTFYFSNLGQPASSIGLNIKIKPLIGNGDSYSFSAGQHNIPNIGDIGELPVVLPSYSFYSDDADSAAFEITSYLVTDTETSTLRRELRHNDTTNYIYRFHDYYAYDDGTAENGYGLYGSGSSAGSVAVMFTSYAADSLRGVYLYFNKTIKEVNTSNKIKLAVWADNGAGQPGNLLYVQDTVRPNTSSELNKFVPYKFSKGIAIGYNQTFYVGWMQVNEDFVNIGFDRNRNHQDKTFYHLNNAWYPSAYEGSLMLRPIFASSESDFPPNPVLPPVQSAVSDAVMPVPNPASSSIRLHWKESQAEPLKTNIELFDMRGRLVKTQQVSYGESVDVSSLTEGVYFIRIKDENNKFVETSKVIIKK